MAFQETKVTVEVTFIDDKTASNRALNSLRSLSKGSKRTKGVDLEKEIPGAPARISSVEAAALAASLEPQKLDEAFHRLNTMYGLNELQVAAAKSFLTNCYNLVWGPAGNGKTMTLAAVTSEIARLKIPHIIACASNRAVDTTMGDCLRVDPNLRAVWFVGGTRGRKTETKAPDAMDLDEGVPTTDAKVSDTAKDTKEDNVVMELGEGDATEKGDEVDAGKEPDNTWELFLDDIADSNQGAHPEYLYGVVKVRSIHEWASEDGHAQHDNAIEYLEHRQSLQSKRGKEKKETRKQMVDLDYDLNKYFLQNCVDVVFVTCSSACHIDLTSFQPKIATMDESGQSTIGDDCMLTAPFKESILTYNKLGDYVQLAPSVIAADRNEAINTLNKSLFERQILDSNKRWPYHMLKQHYRSHSDITALVNKLLYGGEMVNDVSTLQEDGLQKSLRQFLAPLGPAWSGKWRMAIDVSHEKAISQKYGNTSSLCNDAEADMIVAIITKMIAFSPVNDGTQPACVKIEAGHIGIFTPYKGQVRNLAKKLQKAGIKTSRNMKAPMDTLKFLGTTHASQGSAVDIGLVTGVVRDPKVANKHTQFTGGSKNIAVNITRSRKLDIYLANLGPMVDVLQETNAQKRESAHLLRRELTKFREMIETLHNDKLIISHQDVNDALLEPKPRSLNFSRYQMRRPNPVTKFSKRKAKSAGTDSPTSGGNPGKGADGAGRARGASAFGGNFGKGQKRDHPAPNNRSQNSSWRSGPAPRSLQVSTSKSGQSQIKIPGAKDAPMTSQADVTARLGSLIVGENKASIHQSGDPPKKQSKREFQKAEAAKLNMSYTAYKKKLMADRATKA